MITWSLYTTLCALAKAPTTHNMITSIIIIVATLSVSETPLLIIPVMMVMLLIPTITLFAFKVIFLLNVLYSRSNVYSSTSLLEVATCVALTEHIVDLVEESKTVFLFRVLVTTHVVLIVVKGTTRTS